MPYTGTTPTGTEPQERDMDTTTTTPQYDDVAVGETLMLTWKGYRLVGTVTKVGPNQMLVWTDARATVRPTRKNWAACEITR
jgi:hypothetical protein